MRRVATPKENRDGLLPDFRQSVNKLPCVSGVGSWKNPGFMDHASQSGVIFHGGPDLGLSVEFSGNAVCGPRPFLNARSTVRNAFVEAARGSPIVFRSKGANWPRL